MRDKKDRLQAHLFMVGRLVCAVVARDPDAHETPMRRSMTGAFAGMALTILIVGGYMVVGLVSPSTNTDWREDGALVIDEDTATRYLFIDEQLHPTVNATSAALVMGSRDGWISVSSEALDGTPRGPTIGIVGAPDTLPVVDDLSRQEWLVCTVDDGSDSDVHEVLVWIDDEVDDDEADDDQVEQDEADGATAEVEAAEDDPALLVTTSGDDARYLVVGGEKFRIVDPVVLAALGLDDDDPTVVAAAWLNAFETGPDLTTRSIPGRGDEGPTIAGAASRVGQVFAVDRAATSEVQHYALLSDGLLAVSDLEAALLLGSPDAAESYPGEAVRVISAATADVAAVAVSTTTQIEDAWPIAIPTLSTLDDDATACVAVAPDEAGSAATRALRIVAEPTSAVRVPSLSGEDNDLAAQQVQIPAGVGVLAQAEPNAGAGIGTLFLVTEVGVKHPFADVEAVASVGFADVSPLVMPAEILDFLPTGPSLDSAAARTEVPIRPDLDE